jgi:ribosomal protein S18
VLRAVAVHQCVQHEVAAVSGVAAAIMPHPTPPLTAPQTRSPRPPAPPSRPAEKRVRPERTPADEEAAEVSITEEIEALRAVEIAAGGKAPAAAGAAAGDAASFLDGLSSLDEDEDLLAPAAAAAAAAGAAGGAGGADRPAARRRQPWREPLFAARGQAAPAGALGDAAALEESATAMAAAGEGGASSSSSAAAAGASSLPPPPAPRPHMPELYVGMPLDPVTRILAAASAPKRGAVSGAAFDEWGAEEADEDEDDGGERASLPAQGTGVDFCVFCYHGTGFLHEANSALLSKFVSERGSILPKRFTRCCAKHQRK